jgi:maltooligosyltrehalose trehalohydrolase
MKRDHREYWKNTIEDWVQNISYYYRLDDKRDRSDPASHYQPNGVHAPSQVIDHSFPWEDGVGKDTTSLKTIIYELHVGTFTPNGTFDAVICHLDELNDLG